jgi:GNAT superfamily N-acetyltransferase
MPHPIERRAVADLDLYAQVSIAFEGRSRLDLGALREGRLVEIPTAPFCKQYDLLSPPARWPQDFDVRAWTLLSTPGGGAAVAWNTPALDLLEGRTDQAILWDLRVAPDQRGRGTGRALVEAACGWARERGCVAMLVETQDINVAACRFYAAVGFRLDRIVPDAYPGLDEAMLLWRAPL